MHSKLPKTRIWLKNALAEEITSGKYAFNQVFPGIQQIAETYQVSYLTASRAMGLLRKEGYLRCRNGVGHFVNFVDQNTVSLQKKVNFIISRDGYSFRKQFFLDAIELFHAKDWSVKIFPCSPDNIGSVFSEINSPESYSIVTDLRIPWESFQASLGFVAKRVIILGGLSGNPEITSILSNEYETIQQAMRHFKKLGRKNVAILAQPPIQQFEALRIGAWRSALSSSGHSYSWIARHCFSFSPRPDRNDFIRFCDWLRTIRSDTDGLIVPVHHPEVISACLKCGIRIPQELALLLIGLSTPKLNDPEKSLTSGETPDVDVLDHNFAGHFQCALEILEERFSAGKKAEGYWYFCPPGSIRKYEY